MGEVCALHGDCAERDVTTLSVVTPPYYVPTSGTSWGTAGILGLLSNQLSLVTPPGIEPGLPG